MCQNRETCSYCDCTGHCRSAIPPPTVLCCFIFVLCCLTVALQVFLAMKMVHTSKQFTNITNVAYKIIEAIENTETEGWTDRYNMYL